MVNRLVRPMLITCAFFVLIPSLYVHGQSDGRDNTQDSNLGKKTAEQAFNYLGAPYMYAGTGSNGLDCSGLIYRVYRDNGVEVPRTVRTLIHTGKRVSGSLQEGDLVFFNTFGRAPSHVGIYIGDNRFIHAASKGEETGVIISSLDKKYYNDRYLHARRIREADIPSGPPSGGFLADIARRQPRDIFSLRINSYVGLGSGGVTAERFYADFETGINIGQGRIDTALFMEGNTLSDGRTQIALSQEASFTYSGDWLVGGGVQWDWLRANTESDSDGSTPARKYAAVAYFGEAGEKWYLRGQYNIPVPWIFEWQHIFNVKISGLYQPFHWLQLEAELFSDTLERSSGELLDHQYGAGAGVGFRYPASFLWGVEYRLRFLSPVGEAPDTFDHASGDRWTFFVEYTY